MKFIPKKENPIWTFLTALGVCLFICIVALLGGCSTIPSETQKIQQVESKFFITFEETKVYVPTTWPDANELLAQVFPMSRTTVDLTMWKGGLNKIKEVWHIVFFVKYKEVLKVLFYYKTDYKEKEVVVYNAKNNKPYSRISLKEMRNRLREIWKQEKKEGV